MDKRRDKNDVEDRFHFNASDKDQKLVAKTLVDVAMLSNFLLNVEIAICIAGRKAGGDSGPMPDKWNPKEQGRTKVICEPLGEASKKKVDDDVRAADRLKAKSCKPISVEENRPGKAPTARGDSGSTTSKAGGDSGGRPDLSSTTVNDISGWLTLPFEDMRSVSFVSRAAAQPLRHDTRIPRDLEQGVDFKKFYGIMHQKVVIEAGKNVFQSNGALLNRMIQGGDRPRYQIKLKDGGDSVDPMIFYSPKNAWRIDVLEKLNDQIEKVRALQGHSGPIRESLAGSRVLVTEKHATILFHGTEYACIEGIKKHGLLCGGLKNAGRI
jgi:RNA:NAD 2'-phosphotransferase (TPT1/KptA family)